jgi:hypothetical protein|tara:strand:- start:1057 stop:1233 length:177 start_codon:yes stop_codon:yes gene_type:complete
MKIDFTATDEDGIQLSASYTGNFEYEEDIQEFLILVLRFLIKTGAKIPEEITDELEKY